MVRVSDVNHSTKSAGTIPPPRMLCPGTFGGTGTAPGPCVARVLPAHGWTAVQCGAQCGRQRARGDVCCERPRARMLSLLGRVGHLARACADMCVCTLVRS